MPEIPANVDVCLRSGESEPSPRALPRACDGSPSLSCTRFSNTGRPPPEGSAPKVPRRYYFCRLLAEGRRDLVGKYDLKKRNYIGTTSLDAELSLLMANLARVRPADLVYDPYCGTAGTLVAAAARVAWSASRACAPRRANRRKAPR